jgi:hypothetical protein
VTTDTTPLWLRLQIASASSCHRRGGKGSAWATRSEALEELEARLDPEKLASAREAAAGLDLGELVSATLADPVR